MRRKGRLEPRGSLQPSDCCKLLVFRRVANDGDASHVPSGREDEEFTLLETQVEMILNNDDEGCKMSSAEEVMIGRMAGLRMSLLDSRLFWRGWEEVFWPELQEEINSIPMLQGRSLKVIQVRKQNFASRQEGAINVPSLQFIGRGPLKTWKLRTKVGLYTWKDYSAFRD